MDSRLASNPICTARCRHGRWKTFSHRSRCTSKHQPIATKNFSIANAGYAPQRAVTATKKVCKIKDPVWQLAEWPS